jgi:hypothetical protein
MATRKIKQIPNKIIVIIGILAGLVYSSWPLGFLVNPVASHQALASQLEASHQPYNWLFIGLDILSGGLLLAVGYWQWFKRAKNRKLFQVSIIGYVVFAVLVIAAAIAPYDCNTVSQSCILDAHSPSIIIHGFASIVSVVALGISLAFVSVRLYVRHAMKRLGLMGLIILGWAYLGIDAVVQLHDNSTSIVLIEDLFITICSLSIAAIVASIEYDK